MKKLSKLFDAFSSARKQSQKAGLGVALAIVFAGGFVSTASFAKSCDDCKAKLISFTGLTPLPNTSMAVITGTGLPLPSLNQNSGPHSAVTLWDEIRPQSPQSLVKNGTVTITVNGVLQ